MFSRLKNRFVQRLICKMHVHRYSSVQCVRTLYFPYAFNVLKHLYSVTEAFKRASLCYEVRFICKCRDKEQSDVFMTSTTESNIHKPK